MFKKLISPIISLALIAVLFTGCNYSFYDGGYTPLDSVGTSGNAIVADVNSKVTFFNQGDEVDSAGDNYAALVAKNKISAVVSLYTSTEGVDSMGAGTGFIISNDGYVITNAHVLNYTVKTYVMTAQGRRVVTEQRQHENILALFNRDYSNDNQDKSVYYKLSLEDIDTDRDLALLKFENEFNYYTDDSKTATANGFQRYCEFANSDDFGEPDLIGYGIKVVAIGNAQDYGLSVTTGVISMPYNERFKSIQTNTSINPGNSGGPLFNEYGMVVGVVSSKIVDDTVDNIGFAIPSNDVVAFIAKNINK